jgi:hypothetical protein
MKYRIYCYAVKNGTIQNVKTNILTNNIEAERKKLKEKYGHTIHLYYETDEPYKE